jgi:tetratricopeptide (TPR) repeat protein
MSIDSYEDASISGKITGKLTAEKIDELKKRFMEVGKYEEAIICFERAHNIEPDLVDPLYNMASAYERLGSGKERLRYITRFWRRSLMMKMRKREQSCAD